MKPTFSGLLFLGILIVSSHTYAETVTLPKATILCPVNENSGALRWAYGEIQFPNGFEFYGPARKKIEGVMSFRFSNLDRASVHVAMVGNHLRGEHFDSPDYWILTGVTETGETIRFNLEQHHQSQDFAFGESYRGDQKFTSSCKVNLTLPASTKPSKPHCHPLAPC